MLIFTIHSVLLFNPTLKVFAFLLLNAGLLFGHPFDMIQNNSASKILIKEKNIQFTVKFPVHAYVNLWVNSREEYDEYIKKFTSPIEKEKILSYFRNNYYSYEKKDKLKLQINKIFFEYPEYGSIREPEFIVISGIFHSNRMLSDLYIFNDLFLESDKPHLGQADIEFLGTVFEFMFAKKKYFYINLEKYRQQAEAKNKKIQP